MYVCVCMYHIHITVYVSILDYRYTLNQFLRFLTVRKCEIAERFVFKYFLQIIKIFIIFHRKASQRVISR